MKRGFLIISVVLFFGAVFALEYSPKDYCPLEPGSKWTYGLFNKKENKQRADVQASVNKPEKYGKLEYSLYEVPSRGIRCFVRADDEGIWVKAAQMNLPVLSFIYVTLELENEANILAVPIQAGKKWRYEGNVKVKTLLIINIKAKVIVDMENKGLEEVSVNGNTVNAYHISARVNRNLVDNNPMTGSCWMANGIGLVKAETANSRLTIK
ncbi:MAG: hypothetical protein CVV21_09995 [Candidatus Goldiibacteriota bacterium HGW-Goldbacteria-1]|jgi:hypothetical protein|nr:MAG: hypothetical protein CVV21_09995 [Candidatus Goldiibacteriota bacterium HGW-Goldbacteria-1]